MKYYLEAGGRHLVVEVRDLGGGTFAVALEGREHQADFADVDRLGQYALRLGPRSFAVSIEEQDAGPLLVRIAGESFRVSTLDERERAAGAVRPRRAQTSEVVRAPMPGVVIGVRVQPGDRVAAGAPVVVIDAMKMQNEIPAQQGGVVREIRVGPGQAVAQNEPLVLLDPAP